MTSANPAPGSFICDICGRTLGESEGTAIHGFSFRETVTQETDCRIITREGFTLLSIWRAKGLNY